MRASGDLNPNAILVISRILVLVDSIRPLDRLCSIAARILARCLTMLFCSLTNDGIRRRRAQRIHRARASAATPKGHGQRSRRAYLRGEARGGRGEGMWWCCGGGRLPWRC